MVGYYSSVIVSMVVLHRRTEESRQWGKRTEVVLTPQSSAGGCGEGAAGVSMNSKSSDDSECVFDMTAVSPQRSLYGQEARVRLKNGAAFTKIFIGVIGMCSPVPAVASCLAGSGVDRWCLKCVPGL